MAKLSISKTEFRALIKEGVRKSIREQVVGYSAPEQDETKDQADDYLTVGQTSVAAAPDSQPEKAAADTSTRELTQQRQVQLDKDDAVTADDTGRQLQDLLDQKNEGTMRLTRKQLRKAIREACGLEQGAPAPAMQMMPAEMPIEQPMMDSVPVPQDYNAVRDFLEANPDLVDMSINAVMDMAGVGCERSSAQGIIDHLQDMVSPPPAVDLMGMLEGKYTSNPQFQIPQHARKGFEGVPYLEDSAAGNGMSSWNKWDDLVPIMQEIGDPMYGPAIDIIQRKGEVPYIPFIYGDKVLLSLQAALDAGSAPAALTQDLISQAGYELGDEDNEYIDWRDERDMFY
tara:strand:+ start:399 stop:1424 length:1026 start_codon:yes stop_codon:yes gene_type:complete